MADDTGTLEDPPPDTKNWNKNQVSELAKKLTTQGVDVSVADILCQQDIDGRSCLILERTYSSNLDITSGPAILLHTTDEMVKELSDPKIQVGRPCKPYPFDRNHDMFSYVESNVLDVTESGGSNFIEPCHEYKAFINTPDEEKMNKFTSEVIRFAAACMNSRTNGTIHFGIGDKPDFVHGQVLGVVVHDKASFTNELELAITRCFDDNFNVSAHRCIRPPRFVEVLNKNTTSSGKCVIEVDIVPASTICGKMYYHTYDRKRDKKEAKSTKTKASKCFYVRDGGSSCNLLDKSGEPTENYEKFKKNMSQLIELRKNAEEEHLMVIKTSTQGSRLSKLITGGSMSLDKTHFQQYVVVTNRANQRYFECLKFLLELNPVAVLDFDPESDKDGLQRYFDQRRPVSLHLPADYEITERIEDIAEKLKLTRNTSWVFCNGRSEVEPPSAIDQWLIEKGASVRDVILFLCRKDVLPNKKFLVVFLLFSAVRDRMDPLVEIFSTLLQELKGTEQILCLFDNENAFTSWRDLIESRFGNNISNRCIYELSFAEVNGTILSLWSENRRSKRFIPCFGGGTVPFEMKVEESLNTLDVLCVNQCEGGNEDRITIEENFYKGGKVSWWNFFFSEQPGSRPFIKRDQFDYIMETAIPYACSLNKTCVLLNLFHVPGCGGTTLSMHVLWALRKKFRCAVLRNSNSRFDKVAEQVVKLLMHHHEETKPNIPVLLMIDDFDDMEKVLDLQDLIEIECAQKNIQSKSAQVILLNCMRSESSELTNKAAETILIGNHLSETEQKMFEEKRIEIEVEHKNTATFYGFMIMKKNFKPEYIQGVVSNTLKTFNIDNKPDMLFAVLVLLNVYGKGSSISVSQCEDFLDLKPKPVCGKNKVEDGFGKFSNFIAICLVEGNKVFHAVKIINSNIARQCLHELITTHNVSKASITDRLLTTNQLYENTQVKLLQAVHHILVRRNHSSQEESQFSPVIQEIATETPGMEEDVLIKASKIFEKNPIISQLLASYYYLRKKDFGEAKVWADRAKALSKDSSYIADTVAQVLKHELKHGIANCTLESVSPEKIETFLKIAQSAIDAFQQTTTLAKEESLQRLSIETDNSPFNTSGCLGEVQVRLLVIEVLKKTPVFVGDPVRLDIMKQFLRGEIKLHKIETNDRRYKKNRNYYVILGKFEDMLSQLQRRTKSNIDYLDRLYVNLGNRFGTKDSREQVTREELLRCFRQYSAVFCKMPFYFKSEALNAKEKVWQMKQILEEKKADTYSGILSYLLKDDPTEMQQIVDHYRFICQPQHEPTDKEKINYIYANVVLSCMKLQSQKILPYRKLRNRLGQVLQAQYPSSDRLPLMFITVVLLWPQQQNPVDRNLGWYISQMKTSYHQEMKEVYNDKSPIIHFMLGWKYGYEQVVRIKEIQRCIIDEQEQFPSMWNNGKIWTKKEVRELLYRVTGRVAIINGYPSILADTCYPDVELEVAPMYRTQISGYPVGSIVSFFVGFTMKGPLALDITIEG